MDIQSLFSLEGRIALVTGGSRGIGRMIVEGLLGAGCDRIYITARKAHEIEATCNELGEKVIGIPADLGKMEGIDAVVEELTKREDKLDILVNNAGAAWAADYHDFPEAGWDKVMTINVKAPFFLTQKLHTLLSAAASADKPAKVINIASVDGQTVNPLPTFSYQASKSGIIHLTRRMAAELVSEHIYVTAIAPGSFPSNMNVSARDNPEKSASRVPNGRVGNALDIGGSAVYLASRAGDYTIGETLSVDGGLVNARK